MRVLISLLLALLACALTTGLAQTNPADSLLPPGDSVSNDSVPQDSLPTDSFPNDTLPPDSLQPGTAISFQNRILTVDYDAGLLTFSDVAFVARTTPQTRFHNYLADSLGLHSFVVDQMVLVAGFIEYGDTVRVDSMIALNFLPTDTHYVPQQLVVQLGPEETFSNVGADQALTVIDSIPELRLFLLQPIQNGMAMDSLALTYISSPAVEEIDANYLVNAPEGVQSSQPFIDLQARGDFNGQNAVIMTNLVDAQQVSTGSNVKVGLVDGGIDRTHPLFTGQTIIGYDFLDADDSPDDVAGGPGYGHGTFIAGLIRLIAPGADLRAYRVLDSTGRGNSFAVAKAIVQAVKDSCRVINLSMVMKQPHFAMQQAILYAWNAQTSIVAAVGNDSTSVQLFPASDSRVIAVAALDSTYRLAYFSNFGSHVDICAPGAWIYAPFPTDKFAWWNGTSFAAPFVTGQIALLLGAFPQAGITDIRRAVTTTALPISSYNPGREGQLGAGLLNLHGSLLNFPQNPCGDVDGNGFGPDLADLARLIAYLSPPNQPLPNPDLANVNGSTNNTIDLSDLSLLISYLTGFPAPLQCR